jgi:surface antigen/predicted transcriptional regulator
LLVRRAGLVAASGAIALMVAGSPLGQVRVDADRFTQQIQTLAAQAASLSQEISSLSHASSAALGNALASEQAISTTQGELAQAELQLDRANQNLADTISQLAVVRADFAGDQHDLSQLLVHVYELSDDGTVTAVLVDSKSLQDAMDTLTSIDQVSTRVQTLVSQIHAQRDQLGSLQQQQTRDQATADQLVSSLQTLSAQERSEELSYSHQASTLKGRAATLLVDYRGIQSKIAQVRRAQAAAAAAAAAAAGRGAAHIDGNALPPFAFGPQDDWFPWGQCTWYVASLRNVTWNGNAWEWAWTAREAGRPEGMTPRVGSIVVFGPGGGYSFDGHVAYVVSVQSSHSFTIDEGNYLGLGIVDQRHVGSLGDVEAFIY